MERTETRYCDAKFRVHLFGVLSLWTVVAVSFGECNKIKDSRLLPETSLITNFVQKFIQPYIQSLQFSADKPTLRSSEKSPVYSVIREVIEDLKPYLEDEDGDDKFELKDSDETTIIEFLPKTKNELRTGKELASLDLQTTIQKYETVKAEVKAALDKESVEEKTKKMVMRTLDDLIAQVIGNQCTWKSVDHSLAVFRNGKDAKHNITLDEWQSLKLQYLRYLKRNSLSKSLALFNDFHVFFSKVINDTLSLSDKYKIKCQLIKVSNKTAIGRQDIERTQDGCTDFKICSEELREFLLEFYKSLNDTTVSVFKNYAAMYARDVITEGDESNDINSVPTIINNMGNAIDRRVAKVFIQELIKFKLDKTKNKEANIKILREYVRLTCKRVQKHLKKHLDTDLASLQARLLLTVKQDINMNLGVDLGNLEADTKARICTVLVTCNGRVSQTRRSSGFTGIDSNSVYVKVQVSLDDKLKDAIVRTNKEIFRSIKNKPKNNYEMEFRRYGNFNVTRTTIKSMSTTKKLGSDLSDINQILNNSVLEMF